MSRESRRAMGRALGMLRRRKGKSMRQAAERAGISQSTFRLWELGQVDPSIEHLRAALLALEGDFHDLQDVLEAVETLPEVAITEDREVSEEERLIREIVEGFARLLKVRREGGETGGGS